MFNRVLHRARVFHYVFCRVFHRVFHRACVFHRALLRVFHRVSHRVFHLVFSVFDHGRALRVTHAHDEIPN